MAVDNERIMSWLLKILSQAIEYKNNKCIKIKRKYDIQYFISYANVLSDRNSELFVISKHRPYIFLSTCQNIK